MKRKIALIGHSNHLGGAESAFLALLTMLIEGGNEVLAVLPKGDGPVARIAQKIGASLLSWEMQKMLADPVAAVTEYSSPLPGLESALAERALDLIITNSTLVFDGAVAAARLRIPHIWSIHEIPEHSPEFNLSVVAPGTIEGWVKSLSDHLIFCSIAAKDAGDKYSANFIGNTVLYPFQSPPTQGMARQNQHTEPLNLYFIGAATERKNPLFAVDTLKALVLRKHDAYLNFIGDPADHTGQLDRLINRRGLSRRVRTIGYARDPYVYFKGRAINLICAACEPFGLSIPESLKRGIPVIAPDSYGPIELLPDSGRYPPGDIAACVRNVETTANNYHAASKVALDTFNKLSPQFDSDLQKLKLAEALDAAVLHHRIKKLPEEFEQTNFLDALNHPSIAIDAIVNSISSVTGHTPEDINKEISREIVEPGFAVGSDAANYDVIPFSYSPEMARLYKEGRGFCVELAANYREPGRLKMTAYVLLRLITERRQRGRNLSILAIGDGIGVDSIRLAAAGFDVHYADIDESVTSKVTGQNIKRFNDRLRPNEPRVKVADANDLLVNQYDVVVALEVIEHVDQPAKFLSSLFGYLKADGLLFISDCFEGVSDHWPTHLVSNERFAGLLPLLAGSIGLHLEGWSTRPLYKPMAFRKTADQLAMGLPETVHNPSAIAKALVAQAQLSGSRSDRLENLYAALKSQRLPMFTHLHRLRLNFMR